MLYNIISVHSEWQNDTGVATSPTEVSHHTTDRSFYQQQEIHVMAIALRFNAPNQEQLEMNAFEKVK